jgi:ribonuclease HII
MICGIDESGRGPVIGKLVVAGVKFVDDSSLVNLNVKDSKKTSPKRRKILADIIKKNAVEYEILMIPARDIDDMRKVMTLKCEIVSKHKADDLYPIVSAASIVAKTARDAEIEKIAKKLEPRLNLPLGSGYPADPITQKFLRTWIDKYKTLPPHTRRSWKTVQNILRQKSIKKLDDF